MYSVQKQKENGRSMIEMLGVLVVMAILTIAGLFFYRTAINKHKAVEVYGTLGVMGAQMFIKQNPGTRNVSNVTITTKGVSGVGNNAIVRVDFGNDTDLCQELKSMYENNTEYEFIGNCD